MVCYKLSYSDISNKEGKGPQVKNKDKTLKKPTVKYIVITVDEKKRGLFRVYET